ncbi:hypothetical protein F4821DRAFT_232735 [Hypoxylon rubiginosum]|uniref:Uncharacterized protein n=1 Tax=Hypoxylon rubiginosum TaxID=110542 RepID=A0ACC0D8T2_9PEZI|nr:hypothetical protein F4821DRAFT_232735 [Hypoxylon rubiginosum]
MYRWLKSEEISLLCVLLVFFPLIIQFVRSSWSSRVRACHPLAKLPRRPFLANEPSHGPRSIVTTTISARPYSFYASLSSVLHIVIFHRYK